MHDTQPRVWTPHTAARLLPVILVTLIGLNACQTTPAKPGRKPFGGTAQTVPGVIQAEEFDEGGPGVSFYRGKPVTISGSTSRNADVQSNADGTAELTELQKDDWFEYTINVTSGGQHDLITRLKSPFSSGYFLKLDGKDLGERIPTPYKGPGDWIEVRTNGLEIPAGTHVLRITFDSGTISNFDKFEFIRITQPIIESVAISLTSPFSASVNKDVALSTTLTGQGAFERGLTWKVEPTTNATLTPSGEQATFRASAAGKYNITATSTSDPSKKSTVTVNASVIQAQSPADVGQWGAKIAWPSVSIHGVVLPNGKIMSWNSSDKGDGYTDDARTIPRVKETVTWLWDPETDPNSTNQTSVLNTHTNMFCAGHSLLPDGKLLVVGGHQFNLHGFPHTNTYDFKDPTKWTAGPNTNEGRWYPTTLVLNNGDVLIANGFIGSGNGIDNQIPEVWQSASRTLRTLTTGDIGEARPYYPMLYQINNGLVFNAGPQNEMSTLDVSGTGQWTKLKSRDPDWRSYGSSVMFKPGKILVVGGGGTDTKPPTRNASIIDTTTMTANSPNPTVTIASPMAEPRRQHNITMLPNGEVIVTGGTSGLGFNDNKNPVMFAESWDSNNPNGGFKKLPSMTVPRLYHSIALLLPDGRVLSAGGAGACESNLAIYGPCSHPDAEIYTPAYLFNPNGTLATRPVITSASSEITYGGQFSFGTDTDIAKASLVKLSSVTHSQNFDQRIYDLTSSLQKNGLSYTATAPTDTNTYAPGYYMLFGLNAAGVPSKAKILQLK